VTDKRDIYRDKHYKKAFGINLSDYREILARQNRKCAICGVFHRSEYKGRALSVDCNYEEGRGRGLLCARCNFLVKYLVRTEDPEALLRRALTYLED